MYSFKDTSVIDNYVDNRTKTPKFLKSLIRCSRPHLYSARMRFSSFFSSCDWRQNTSSRKRMQPTYDYSIPKAKSTEEFHTYDNKCSLENYLARTSFSDYDLATSLDKDDNDENTSFLESYDSRSIFCNNNGKQLMQNPQTFISQTEKFNLCDDAKNPKLATHPTYVHEVRRTTTSKEVSQTTSHHTSTSQSRNNNNTNKNKTRCSSRTNSFTSSVNQHLFRSYRDQSKFRDTGLYRDQNFYRMKAQQKQFRLINQVIELLGCVKIA